MIEGLGILRGPASELGWSIAQAARKALGADIRGWRERNP